MRRKVKDGGGYSLVKNKINYGFTKKERFIETIFGILKLGLIGYIFYKSIIGIVLLELLLPIYLKIKEEEYKNKHIQDLKVEFKEMLLAYRSAVVSGVSPKNAIEYVIDEMTALGYDKGIVIKELKYMKNQIELNVPVSDLFLDWGNRSRVEDILNFSNIFDLIEKTGGSLASVMKDCADIISEKIEVEREIDVIVSSKRYEQKIINVIPLFILLYVDLSSKGFLDPMYQGFFGRGIMTVCLLLYFTAYYLSIRIMRIEV